MKWLAVGFVAMAACTPAPAPDPPSVAIAPPVSGASAPSGSGSSSLSTPSEPPATSSDGAGTRPARTGIGGSTKGTVACGKQRCAAPEGCAWDPAAHDWRCQSPDAPIPDDGTDIGPSFIACDDGTDCPQGQTCCNVWGQHFSPSTACVARADVNAQCASEICMPRDVGGALCPNGRTCEGATATEEGSCVAPKGPATCGGRQTCPASAPYCVTTATGLACAAKDSATWKSVRGTERFECTLQRDCAAGDTCAYEFGEIEHDTETYCGKWHPAYQGSLVCEVGKLEPCGNDAACRASMFCHPRNDGPKWMGVWGTK